LSEQAISDAAMVEIEGAGYQRHQN
jgi:hypothetical protein